MSIQENLEKLQQEPLFNEVGAGLGHERRRGKIAVDFGDHQEHVTSKQATEIIKKIGEQAQGEKIFVFVDKPDGSTQEVDAKDWLKEVENRELKAANKSVSAQEATSIQESLEKLQQEPLFKEAGVGLGHERFVSGNSQIAVDFGDNEKHVTSQQAREIIRKIGGLAQGEKIVVFVENEKPDGLLQEVDAKDWLKEVENRELKAANKSVTAQQKPEGTPENKPVQEAQKSAAQPSEAEVNQFFDELKGKVTKPVLTAKPPEPSAELMDLVRQGAKNYAAENTTTAASTEVATSETTASNTTPEAKGFKTSLPSMKVAAGAMAALPAGMEIYQDVAHPSKAQNTAVNVGEDVARGGANVVISAACAAEAMAAAGPWAVAASTVATPLAGVLVEGVAGLVGGGMCYFASDSLIKQGNAALSGHDYGDLSPNVPEKPKAPAAEQIAKR